MHSVKEQKFLSNPYKIISSFYHTGNADLQEQNFGSLISSQNIVLPPKKDLGMRLYKNTEIINIVLSGCLHYKDSMGADYYLTSGDVHKTSTGKGIIINEKNASDKETLHYIQIQLHANIKDIRPQIAVKNFNKEIMPNLLCQIASPDYRENTLQIIQDCGIYQTHLEQGKSIVASIVDGRKYWIQVINGTISVNNHPLIAGKSMAISQQNGTLTIKGLDKFSHLLLLNLPL